MQLSKTEAEIVARIRATRDEDMFGFKMDVLLPNLDYEWAKAFIRPDVTEEKWQEIRNTFPQDVEGVIEKAKDYLSFAFGKALDHRGLSASRSVDKLIEYAWLLDRDDVVQAMEDAGYENYGVPKLAAFAVGMDFPNEATEEESPELANMAQGKSCRSGCEEGCGS